MTEKLKRALERVEQLPPKVQDAIAEVMQREMDEWEKRRREGLEALDAMAALREKLHQAGCPPVDAAQLIREGREELERRSLSPWLS